MSPTAAPDSPIGRLRASIRWEERVSRVLYAEQPDVSGLCFVYRCNLTVDMFVGSAGDGIVGSPCYGQ